MVFMKEGSYMTYPKSTRVGVVTQVGRVEVQRRPLRSLAPDEVLVAVRASALCGSDLHIARGRHPSAALPVTIGHEFSGDVAAVGEGVDPALLGRRVTVEPCIVCGTCPACRRGDYNYCEHISFTYRNGDGAMADYVAVKASGLHLLPAGMSYETGALLEPLSVATHAVRRAGVALGDTVLVIGDGAIGLLTAAMCRRCGAGRVLVAGHSDSRLALAARFGATDTLNTHQGDPVAWALELTNGAGVTRSFECVGTGACFTQSMECLCRGGTATILGIYEEPDITVRASRFVTHELTVKGAQGYCRDFPDAITAAKDLPLEDLITHTFPLEEIQAAMDTALDRRSGSVKVLLRP